MERGSCEAEGGLCTAPRPRARRARELAALRREERALERTVREMELAALMAPDPWAGETYAFGLLVSLSKRKLAPVGLSAPGREILVERRDAKKG